MVLTKSNLINSICPTYLSLNRLLICLFINLIHQKLSWYVIALVQEKYHFVFNIWYVIVTIYFDLSKFKLSYFLINLLSWPIMILINLTQLIQLSSLNQAFVSSDNFIHLKNYDFINFYQVIDLKRDNVYVSPQSMIKISETHL